MADDELGYVGTAYSTDVREAWRIAFAGPSDLQRHLAEELKDPAFAAAYTRARLAALSPEVRKVVDDTVENWRRDHGE